jgi:hypothetical protein
MFTVAELTSPGQLAEYRLLWRSLESRTRGSSFFHSREWLECYWRHWASSDGVRVLVVHAAQQPIGFVPLVVRPVSTRLGKVQSLQWAGEDWNAVGGPIGPNPTATLVGAFRYLQHATRDWDLIDLRGIDTELDRGRTANALRMAGLPAIGRPWQTVATFQKSELGVADRFRLRQQLGHAERAMWRFGPWDFESASTVPSDGQTTSAAAGLAEGLTLWDEAAPLHSQLAPNDAQFLRDVWETAAWSGQAHLLAIRQHRRVVAIALTVQSADVIEPLVLLCEPGREATAGALLTGRLITDAMDGPVPVIRWSHRVSHWVDGWSPTWHTTERWTHFSWSSPRAHLLRWAQWRQPARRDPVPALHPVAATSADPTASVSIAPHTTAADGTDVVVARTRSARRTTAAVPSFDGKPRGIGLHFADGS